MRQKGSPPASSFSQVRAWRVMGVVVSLVCISAAVRPAWQSGELLLAVRRDWGYGNGDQIQGLFSLEATGPADLVSVTFKIDETVIEEDSSPPFKIQFITDDYAPGRHALSAAGRTADGRTLLSDVRRFEFVSADEAGASVQRILLGTFSLVGVLIVLMIAVQFGPALLGGKRAPPAGAAHRYGLLGGAVCPKCGRPFPIHWWAFNLGSRKYDRCEHCGRWSLVGRATPEQLAAADAPPETPRVEMTADEKWKRQLDDSRYTDDS